MELCLVPLNGYSLKVRECRISVRGWPLHPIVLCEGSVSSLTFGNLTLGRRSRWCPESSLGTGWPSPGIWVFHSPCQAVLLGQLAVFPAYRGSLPRAWSPSPAWRIICDFWWPPRYSSCMHNSNLTILYISWSPNKCGLYLHLNIYQIFSLSVVKSKKVLYWIWKMNK